MKILVLSSIIMMMTQINYLEGLRKDFIQIDSEKKLLGFEEKYNKSNISKKEPYLAVVEMWKAEYTNWPLKQYRYFKEGKNRLENYIKKNNTCIESRYLRILVQKECPSFLGYDKDIKTDIEFIRSNISTSDIPEWYRNIILDEISKVTNKN